MSDCLFSQSWVLMSLGVRSAIRLPACVQGTGDISGNVFSGNSAKQGSTIYRDSCSGSVLTNTGLVSSAVTEVRLARNRHPSCWHTAQNMRHCSC